MYHKILRFDNSYLNNNCLNLQFKNQTIIIKKQTI